MISSRKALSSKRYRPEYLGHLLSNHFQQETCTSIHHSGFRQLHTTSPNSLSPPSSAAAASATSSADFESSHDIDLGKTPHSSLTDHEILKFSDSNLQRLFAEELSAIESLQEQGSKALESIQQKQKLESIQDAQQLELPSSNIHNKNPTMAELIENFDPLSPPKGATLLENQLWFECASQQEAVERYEKVIDAARTRHDYASLNSVQRLLVQWYSPLRDRIQMEQEEYFSKTKITKPSAKKYMPFMCTLQAEKLAVIVSHETTMYTLQKTGVKNPTLVGCALRIADAVEAEVNVQRLLRKRGLEEREKNKALSKSELDSNVDTIVGTDMDAVSQVDENENDNSNNGSNKNESKSSDWMYLPSHLQRFSQELNRNDPTRKGKLRISRANRRASQLLESSEDWTSDEKVVLGVALLQMLLETATIQVKGETYKTVPAFTYSKAWIGHYKSVGQIIMDQNLYNMIVKDKYYSLDVQTTRYKPMVVPPKEWSSTKKGGYEVLNCEFMRTHGCAVQQAALREADLSTVMDGLNALGQVPWKINKKVLEAAQRCWEEGIVLGDIPSQEDFEVPTAPVRPERRQNDDETGDDEYRRYREKMLKYRRIVQKNMDLNSLRSSAMLKLNQARQFEPFEKIYFPYNVDFRGRAYPVPPHLSNVGSDLCRGMLIFAESKPLDRKGLYWLKVHLANLAGADKMSFDERAAFTDNNMDNVRACVDDPFGKNRWWMNLDDPFQGMATCNEIVAAIDSGDPESYECALAVHMDGSCNGLQHYAALGRDKVGGKAVNLCNFDEPQDVYVGVMHEVIRRVAEEADRMVDIDISDPSEMSKAEREAIRDNRAAKLVNGLIDRGVVKRTVMTSVYGVTFIGAKKQIQEKIEEKV